LSGGIDPKRPAFTFLVGLSSYWFALTFIFGAVITILIPSLIRSWFDPEHAGKWIGVVMAAGGIIATAVQLVVGALSDHSTSLWGRRRPFILAGSVFSVLVFLAMGSGLAGYWHFVGLFVLAQVALNIGAAPYTALLPDLIPKEYHGQAAGVMGIARIFGEGIGVFFAARVLGQGSVHGELVSTSVVTGNGLRVLMFTFSLLLVSATIIVLLQCRERPLCRSEIANTWWGTIASIFRTSLRDYPDFSWLLLSRAIINLGVYTVASFLLFFMEYALKVDNPHSATSIIMAVLLVSAAVGSYPAGVISDRYGRKIVLYIACGMTAAAGIAFVFCGSFKLATCFAAVMGLGFGAFLSTDWAFACNLLPPREPARYLAIWNLGSALPQVFAAFIGGLVADAVHRFFPLGMGHRAIFLLSVLYFLLGAGMITKVRETIIKTQDIPAHH